MAPLADQLTLSQPGFGADYAHQIILAPLDYQTFLRPCILKQKTSVLSVVPSNDFTVVQLKNPAFAKLLTNHNRASQSQFSTKDPS